MKKITIINVFSLIGILLLNTLILPAQHDTKYISTDKIKTQFQDKTFVAFPETRENSIQWFDSLKTIWIKRVKTKDVFKFQAQPGEYFTYQLGVNAFNNLNDVKVIFSDLKARNGDVIPSNKMTCFNTGGINSFGQAFSKQVRIKANRVKALWIGVDLLGIKANTYNGKVTVSADGKTVDIPISINVFGDEVPNHGYGEGKRLARMNWLNSKIAIDTDITTPFTPLLRDGNTINMLGRSFTISPDGLPSSISSFFTPSVQSIEKNAAPIIHAPFRFVMEKSDGAILHFTSEPIQIEKETPSQIIWSVHNTSDEIEVLCEGTLEYEGFVDYKITLKAKKHVVIKDIRLEIPIEKQKATYMMGLNYEGGLRPTNTYFWKWDTTRNQDMLWIGDVNGGLRIKWKDENYVRPLVNIYYKFGPLHNPRSWGNNGAGGVTIKEEGEFVNVNAFSGERKIDKNETLHYNFELLITPFRTIDKKVKFGDRYFHGGGTDESTKVAQAEKAGANIINIHHAGDLYPFINYPYLDENVEALKRLIENAHSKDKRMKFYYTTREITKNIPEFWAFNSLDGEIIYPGPGNDTRTKELHPEGPAEWLKINLRENYIPAWYNVIDRGLFKGELDLSVITTPNGRLNNFYIAGLDWMVRNMDLDGVYIDDSALDRFTLRRARKIIDRHRINGRMDLHSWNHFNSSAGFASCLNIYMDLLPYFDLCWIGEGRDYNRMPDHWLIEVSGIPFGLAGQMLEGGGNKWRGMVYGITNRAGWGGDPTEIWKFWDRYSIQDKEMIGYWDRNSPIKLDNNMVKATIYKGKDESIISIAGWGDTDQECSVHIDWQKLGYNSAKVKYEIPYIAGFQDEATLASLSSLIIPKGKGFLIIVKRK
jgi:hypothetical protein